jgi:hypothetical protein
MKRIDPELQKEPTKEDIERWKKTPWTAKQFFDSLQEYTEQETIECLRGNRTCGMSHKQCHVFSDFAIASFVKTLGYRKVALEYIKSTRKQKK